MRLNKKIPVFFILFLMLIIIPISSANDETCLNESQEISINDETDILGEKYDTVYVNASYKNDGNGSSDNPVNSITEGLSLVSDGGTIYLNGNFTSSDNFNITLASSPNNIKFIGVNAVIDGQNSKSFAVIKKGTYSFKDISFVNHYKSGEEYQFGGAILNEEGTLTFTNCLFENNTISGVNRANGGAIDNNGYMTVINCTFINNSAYVSNSSGFRKNAADGGAISNLGKLYVYNTSFNANKALRNGGAIRTQDHSYASFMNCNFTDNLAAYHESGGSFGGAIYSWDCALDISYCIFKNNRVIDISGYGAQGGAISSDRGGDKINILSSQFINNTAKGVQIVSGQSIFFGSVNAQVNYCSIDTSIYSGSTADFNYNFWSDEMKKMIEMLPGSSDIKNFADLEVSANTSKLDSEQAIIYVDLYWNGTLNQEKMNLLPPLEVKLTSNCGKLDSNKGNLVNGHFETKIMLNSTPNPEIIANVNGLCAKLDFSQIISNSNLTATCKHEGKTSSISISSRKYMEGICLVDVGENKYYAELSNGKATLNIQNLDAGTYAVSVRYFGGDNESLTTRLTVSSKKDTEINVDSKITLTATDIKAKEKSNIFSFTLNDSENNVLANKTVKIVMNGKIYTAVTDKSGIGRVKVDINTANTYTCTMLFSGDENHKASPLTITQLIIAKKKTAIKASSKTFKVKSKSKKISVTLKTVKNQLDKKTYLYKGKKLSLKINGKTYTAKTNAKGIAKFSLKLNKKGKYYAKIKFAGDNTYGASVKTVKIIVK